MDPVNKINAGIFDLQYYPTNKRFSPIYVSEKPRNSSEQKEGDVKKGFFFFFFHFFCILIWDFLFIEKKYI